MLGLTGRWEKTRIMAGDITEKYEDEEDEGWRRMVNFDKRLFLLLVVIFLVLEFFAFWDQANICEGHKMEEKENQ
jgi:hypothetical protein